MLRLSMSPQGPRTRSNLWRSRRTHLSGPFAMTVAALGLSSNSAISPVKEKNHDNSSFALKEKNIDD